MSLFCSNDRIGTRKTWISPEFDKVDTCAVASLLLVLKGINFGCRTFISFRVAMLMIFDSAPKSIKNSISRTGVCNCLDFGLSKRRGMVHIFSFCTYGFLGIF